MKIFKPRLILFFLCPLIIHELGLGDKGNRESTYNHGQKSWDTFAFLGHFPIHTGPTPPLTPQCWIRVSRIFSEFQLCIGWGEGELQENFEKDALF